MPGHDAVHPDTRTVLFAGGGSGGHISPGLAIAEQLVEQDPRLHCLFACSDRPVDRSMLERAGADFVPMPARPFSRRLRGLLDFGLGFRRTTRLVRHLLRERRIELVVALGGYVSAPIASAAAREQVPVLLVNLDRVPGKANQYVARRATTILSAVETISTGQDWEVTGMPLRRASLAPGPAADCRRTLDLDPDRNVLLITGASQGARTINEVLPHLGMTMPSAFEGWQVLHLCGDADAVDRVDSQWRNAGIEARVIPFLHEIGVAWGAASACVSRAGASSVAEARANCIPTIFLPYPYHRDDHQLHNAQPMVELGGALIVKDSMDTDLTSAALEAGLVPVLTDPSQRAGMAEALARESIPDAAALVAQRVLSLKPGTPISGNSDGESRLEE